MSGNDVFLACFNLKGLMRKRGEEREPQESKSRELLFAILVLGLKDIL